MTRTNLRRSCLYIGGGSPAKILEARFCDADCVVYDLEDSVAAADKDAARMLIYRAVRYHRPPGKYVLIRVNGLCSPELQEDLEAAVRARPDAIRLPKVETVEEVQDIDRRITAIEETAGIPKGSIELWCNIESALGVANAREIAAASPRITALALGAEDYTASMGARRSKSGWEIFYARMRVLEACRLAGISAQDVVFSDIDDLEGLQKDVENACGLGFDGKTVIHPRQIEIVNQAFTPTPKEIRQAQRVLEALERGAREHTGVVVLDGSMVDKPMEKRARDVLARAEAAGLLDGEEW